jgi:hypothetical protein
VKTDVGLSTKFLTAQGTQLAKIQREPRRPRKPEA